MKRKAITITDVRMVLFNRHGLVEPDLFDHDKTSHEKREAVLNDLFIHFTQYQMVKGKGLSHTQSKDEFSSYRNFNHLTSLKQVTYDLNRTNLMSRDPIARLKRKQFRKKRERFEERKQKKIQAIDQKIYHQKWEPNTKKRLRRLEALKEKRSQEQKRAFDR
jgi:hypothetical protein